jgi:hypothetical protein
MTQAQTTPAHDRLARRVSVAQGTLGALSAVAVVVVFVRLVERWRVSPSSASHHIVILGQRIGYPAANVGAIVVLALALLGAVVMGRAFVAAVRELTAARRLGRRLSGAAPLEETGALLLARDERQAFCAGLLRPRVYVTTGAVAALDGAALQVVLAHERHHARRRDPLRLAAGRVLAAALFFVPGVTELSRRREALAEIGADEAALAPGPERRSALARAMLSFTESPATASGVGIDPDRIDHLLGEPPRWRFPAGLVVAALASIGLVAAVAVLAGDEAAGTASLAPPFLSAQPCIVVLALIPAALALAAVSLVRRRSNYRAS